MVIKFSGLGQPGRIAGGLGRVTVLLVRYSHRHELRFRPRGWLTHAAEDKQTGREQEHDRGTAHRRLQDHVTAQAESRSREPGGRASQRWACRRGSPRSGKQRRRRDARGTLEADDAKSPAVAHLSHSRPRPKGTIDSLGGVRAAVQGYVGSRVRGSTFVARKFDGGIFDAGIR